MCPGLVSDQMHTQLCIDITDHSMHFSVISHQAYPIFYLINENDMIIDKIKIFNDRVSMLTLQ